MSLKKIDFKKGKLYSIQINNIIEYNDIKNYINIDLVDKKRIKKYTLEKIMMEKSLLNEDEINNFRYDLDDTGVIELSTKLSELPESYLSLIYLKCISTKEITQNIYFGNGGMHYDNLKLCYSIIKTILDKKGTCVMFNYPPSDNSILTKYIDKEKVEMII
ncbi:hypothetical protein TDCHD05_170010 [Tenacibaculum dicentrarchi]|nr:hypothetical protein TDCHD05_170010 [Tenacibaculum dicentrarchi]